MKTNTPQCTPVGAVLFALLSSVAVAATAEEKKSDSETVQLSQFIVQEGQDKGYLAKNSIAGTRTAERLLDIPQNIQIINQELLADLNQTFGFEAIKYGSSGVVRRSNRTDDAFVRGFRVNAFLRDGVPYTAGTINSVLYDVDRIEVIKGPAALLYGQASSVGGVINYVTKRPTKRPAYSARATVGTNDFYKFDFNASGPTMVDTVRYRATLGRQDNKFDKRFGYYDDYFIGGGIDWTAGATTTIALDFNYVRIDSFPDFTFADAAGRIAPRPKNFSVNEAWAGYINHSYLVNLTIATRISPTFEMRLFASYKYDSRDGRQPVPVGLAADGVTLTRRVQDVLQIGEPKTLQLDFLKTFDFKGTRNKISLGAEARRGSDRAAVFSQTLAPLNTLNPAYGALPGPFETFISDALSTGNNLRTGAYLQDQTTFWNGRFIVVAGARFNAFDNTSRNLLNNTTTNFYDDTIINRIGFIYKPIKEVSVYYNDSESFVFQTGNDYLGRPFQPSVGTVDEYGVKFEGLGGAVFASAAYFKNSLTNARTFILLPGFGTQQFPVQGGLESTKGFEIDVGVRKEWAAATLNLTTSYYAGKSRDAQGARPINAPRNTLSGFAKLSLTTGAAKGFGVGFGAYHVSDRLGTAAYVFPAYTVALGTLSYDAKNWRAAVTVDNLFDKIYADGSEGRVWLFTGERRGFKVTADYRF